MVKAVYPGSFDPVTCGHVDIIRRAARVVDELIIGVLVNSEKNPMFSMEERCCMLSEAVGDIPNIIRGLRAVTDFENEMQLAQTNHSIDSDIDTLFLTTSLEYAFLSSTIVKEIAYYGSDISKLVPENVAIKLKEKFNNNK